MIDQPSCGTDSGSQLNAGKCEMRNGKWESGDARWKLEDEKS